MSPQIRRRGALLEHLTHTEAVWNGGLIPSPLPLALP
jgi:hypothetical protein